LEVETTICRVDEVEKAVIKAVLLDPEVIAFAQNVAKKYLTSKVSNALL
jgi:hypothetical protein